MDLTRDKLARMIDHTELKPDADRDRIRTLCEEAVEYGFYSVCVNSCNVRMAAKLLRKTDVTVCSVVGFPLGAMVTRAKAFEAQCAIEDGATEIDMVINIGALKARDYDMVHKDIAEVVNAAKGNVVKVILETGFLTPEEIRDACRIAEHAGAHFVKTSTGFGPRGASIEDIRLMHEVVGERVGIKAAGGIRTFNDALRMIRAGATRIGASRGIQIIEGFHETKL